LVAGANRVVAERFHIEPRSFAWTISLIVCNRGAAIAYFFLVWRPAHARVDT
jgi:hypothetical protein